MLYADPLDTWTPRSSGTSQQLNGLIYGGGRFVAVGSAGTIVTSPDAVTWKTVSSGTQSDLNDVAYGNGMFIAVAPVAGQGGNTLTSPDGETWTIHNPFNVNGSITNITYVNGRFFASGGNYNTSFIFTSTDGVTWAEGDKGVLGHTGRVSYGNGIYIASGYGANISTSTDAINWSVKANLGYGSIVDIIYVNGQFVAVGGLFYWGGALIFQSSDGVTWKQSTLGSLGTSRQFNSIAYGASQYVTVGTTTNTASSILTSSDAITWVSRASGTSKYLTRIVYVNGLFVAVGESGTILTSSAGNSTSNTLTISRTGTGSGTVTSSPSGINCSPTCSAAFAAGTSVNLTATPDSTSTFTGWSDTYGECSGTIPMCTVTMSVSKTVTATFGGSSPTPTPTPTPIPTPTPTPSSSTVTNKDFNGDGIGDILWQNTRTGMVYIYLMNKDGSIQSSGSPATVADLNWKIKDINDYNGDGKSDILWQNTQTGLIYIWFMDGVNIKSAKQVALVPDSDWQIFK
ncbi:MAG: VCBS repeat-containing protein [Nitrospirae bacterium]|nr:VCBS repeat-containing protein [Nitrospirota bacterium]